MNEMRLIGPKVDLRGNLIPLYFKYAQRQSDYGVIAYNLRDSKLKREYRINNYEIRLLDCSSGKFLIGEGLFIDITRGFEILYCRCYDIAKEESISYYREDFPTKKKYSHWTDRINFEDCIKVKRINFLEFSMEKPKFKTIKEKKYLLSTLIED